MPNAHQINQKEDQINQKEEIHRGMFEWKIERFLEQEGVMTSPSFEMVRDACCLSIPERSKTCCTCQLIYQVHMYGTELFQSPLFGAETLYKTSLIDRYGQDFLTKEGSLIKGIISALCFHRLYLEEHAETILPDGNLTIRISWFRANDKNAAGQQGTRVEQDSTPDKEPPKLLETLSKDLHSFYESQTGTDCVLRVGDKQFSVHQQVLSARSEVFAAMFRHDKAEGRSGVVDILDVDATVLSNVIRYVYSGEVHGMTEDTAAPMYEVADKYALIEMRDVCLDFLMHNLTIENVCDAATVAHRHAESQLEEKVVLFIDNKFEQLEETDKWIEFSKYEPLLSMKFLRSAYSACRKRQNFFKKVQEYRNK